MEILPKEVLDEFLRGQHVMRHRPDIYNGLWSDMYIERTFMRYGHGLREIINLTVQPSTLNRWALNLHNCSRLTHEDIFTSEDSTCDMLSDKHELSNRIQADKVDRGHIHQKMDSVINPLANISLSSTLVNIVTGQVAQVEVNVGELFPLAKRNRKN